MNLSDFLAQVDFFTPMIFRISVAAELALFASSKNRSNSIAIPRLPRSRGALRFPQYSSSKGFNRHSLENPPDSS